MDAGGGAGAHETSDEAIDALLPVGPATDAITRMPPQQLLQYVLVHTVESGLLIALHVWPHAGMFGSLHARDPSRTPLVRLPVPQRAASDAAGHPAAPPAPAAPHINERLAKLRGRLSQAHMAVPPPAELPGLYGHGLGPGGVGGPPPAPPLAMAGGPSRR
jgi:hypothetical protein